MRHDRRVVVEIKTRRTTDGLFSNKIDLMEIRDIESILVGRHFRKNHRNYVEFVTKDNWKMFIKL